MRRQIASWFEPSTEPLNNALVTFDYGAGAVVGIYRNGRFSSLKTPTCSWPKLRINRWRYCTPPDNFCEASRSIAA